MRWNATAIFIFEPFPNEYFGSRETAFSFYGGGILIDGLSYWWTQTLETASHRDSPKILCILSNPLGCSADPTGQKKRPLK